MSCELLFMHDASTLKSVLLVFHFIFDILVPWFIVFKDYNIIILPY